MAGVGVLKVQTSPGVWVPVGGGTEEVHVGTTAPTDPGIEVWYDTDAPNVLTSDQRWYTAWGIIARFPALTGPISVPAGGAATALTGNLAFTFINGRRYRIAWYVRAIQNGATAQTAGVAVNDGASTIPSFIGAQQNVMIAASAQWDSIYGEAVVEGAGQSYSNLNIKAATSLASTWHIDLSSQFYIEDLGPTIGTSVMPTQSTGPMGVMGYAQVTANFTGITTQVDLAGLSVTFTAVSGRRYKVTGYTPAGWSTVASDSVGIQLRTGANVQLQSAALEYVPVASFANSMHLCYVGNTFSGSTTLKLSASRGGTGTATIAANTQGPAFILVEDIGV